jgi:hypothetical protein
MFRSPTSNGSTKALLAYGALGVQVIGASGSKFKRLIYTNLHNSKPRNTNSCAILNYANITSFCNASAPANSIRIGRSHWAGIAAQHWFSTLPGRAWPFKLLEYCTLWLADRTTHAFDSERPADKQPVRRYACAMQRAWIASAPQQLYPVWRFGPKLELGSGDSIGFKSRKKVFNSHLCT